MTTAFEKLFKAYCSKKALDATTLVFITSEGQRILGHQTPADVSGLIILSVLKIVACLIHLLGIFRSLSL